MEENNLPKIIRAQKQQKDKIKGVLKLGFSSDPLIRWVFPDPNIYLVNFDNIRKYYLQQTLNVQNFYLFFFFFPTCHCHPL